MEEEDPASGDQDTSLWPYVTLSILLNVTSIQQWTVGETKEANLAPNPMKTSLTDGCYVTVITDPENPKFDLEAFIQAKAAENP